MSALFISNSPLNTPLTSQANGSDTNCKLLNKQVTTARCPAKLIAIGAIAITTVSLVTALATRQIVYTVAPQIVEYITTEAIQSLLPE